MNYEKDILQEAKDFLSNNEDMIKEAIKNGADWDYNDIDSLDENWHCEITDRSYSLEDAAYIISHADNVETDSGLWEGQDPQDALRAQAAYSYANDVWFECERIFKEMKDEYEEDRDHEEDHEEDENFNTDKMEEENDKLLDDIIKRATAQPIEPAEQGSEDEKELIERWLNLNANAGLWGGYPVGSSYIDARCGSGHGMPDIKEYVDFDQEFRKKVPHLDGKRKEEVKAYLEKTFGPKHPTEEETQKAVENIWAKKDENANLIKDLMAFAIKTWDRDTLKLYL